MAGIRVLKLDEDFFEAGEEVAEVVLEEVREEEVVEVACVRAANWLASVMEEVTTAVFVEKPVPPVTLSMNS